MTFVDLDALERKALAATPGPWRRCTCGRCGLVWGNADTELVASTTDSVAPCRRDANADYLSLVSPAVVLDLIGRLRKAEATLNSAFVAATESVTGKSREEIEAGAARVGEILRDQLATRLVETLERGAEKLKAAESDPGVAHVLTRGCHATDHADCNPDFCGAARGEECNCEQAIQLRARIAELETQVARLNAAIKTAMGLPR